MKKLLSSLALTALLLTGCGTAQKYPVPTPIGVAPVDEPTFVAPEVEPEPEPEPEAIPTSGSYAADVLALGITPDDMDGYQEFMKGNACDKTGTSLGTSVRSIGSGTPENGSGPDILRLTATYFCPDQLPEIEKLLEYFDE